ncbi:serine hydrolase domain-containing protein [Microbacterium sp. LWS13-1.2]|uniref:Beta-lactamase family protein n=1 Tax=Microbacterium sp. LWS13-1.2 TaxID=3135264 RepID=A0AAU6SEJ1_9MICO
MVTMAGSAHGEVSEGYEGVAEAFFSALASSPRGGAALCIMVDGVTVVDLWGGDTGRGPWTRDTPTVLFSCSKGLLAVLVARLVESDRIDLDAPVVDYWPEFAQGGKREVTVRMVMSHAAGLSHLTTPVSKSDMVEWDPVVAALAAQVPLWQPGEGWSYHAITFGWIVGEVVRRVTGLTVGQAFADIVATPTHADVWFGVPRTILGSVARVEPMDRFTINLIKRLPGGRNVMRALTLDGALPDSLVGDGTGFNDPDLQVAEIPGAGGIGSAVGVAAVWSSLVTGTEDVRPLSAAVRADMTRPRTSGKPRLGSPVLPTPRWGTGFQVDAPGRPLLSPTSFGHDGAGGQLAFADTERRMGFAFLTSQMGGVTDRRSHRILNALRQATSRRRG